eukprot:9466317-Pyramimonas_sp.AAC.1
MASVDFFGQHFKQQVDILSPRLGLVPAMGIFSFPFCDWCSLWVYSLCPSGAHCDDKSPPGHGTWRTLEGSTPRQLGF